MSEGRRTGLLGSLWECFLTNAYGIILTSKSLRFFFRIDPGVLPSFPIQVICLLHRSSLICAENGVKYGKIIQILFCRTLFSKHDSNWLKTFIESHLFSFWLLISFLFLFHLLVCLKKRKRGKIPFLILVFPTLSPDHEMTCQPDSPLLQALS